MSPGDRRDRPRGAGDAATHSSRRTRTRSASTVVSTAMFLAGLAAVGYALVRFYRPTALEPWSLDPIGLDLGPVVDLSVLAGTGVLLVFLGTVLFVLARQAEF